MPGGPPEPTRKRSDHVMHPDEEGLIQQLATKMQQDQPVEKDAEAAALIDQSVATQPDAV